MGVIYFLICVRKHESNLPTNIRTTAGEENAMIYRKSETTFLPCFMIAWCDFFYQSVCVFYQWCLSYFPSEHYISMFLVEYVQCW